MLKLFSMPWPSVPTVWIDTETTGTKPGIDCAVQVGLVRFEAGLPVGSFCSLVSSSVPIPATATAIHGITDADLVDAPPIAEVFRKQEVLALLAGAQPAAYNAPFDRNFVPPFGDEWTWPWLDSLSIVRHVDQFVKGKGRHQLATTAFRHNIEMGEAHNAEADAKMAGLLFYKIAPEKFGPQSTLGDVLRWQRVQEAEQWFRFADWRSKQPPMESANG